MIAGIEAFKRRRDAFVPMFPDVPKALGTREPNRDGLSPRFPLFPEENSIAASETRNTAFLVTLVQADQADGAIADCLPTDEAAAFWPTFLERVDHCDQLIDQLCNLRGDSAAERTVLLKTRRNTSPENLDGDITYLLTTIAALTPPPPVPATGRCVDCESFRRAGVGERCGHAARCTPGEPPVTACLPSHTCSLFVHWRGA